MWQIATVIGPSVAGVLIASAGVAWVYVADAVSYTAVLSALRLHVVFGLSQLFWLSLLALAGTGAADTVNMILRQTVRQIVTPDALRGRMSSVGMLFFMGGPQLGEVEASVVARGFGAPFSVVFDGVAALVATALIAARVPTLRTYHKT
jgi:hypothetical protein